MYLKLDQFFSLISKDFFGMKKTQIKEKVKIDHCNVLWTSWSQPWILQHTQKNRLPFVICLYLSLKYKWYFVTKIVWTYCKKKLFKWSRTTFEIWGWRARICKVLEITRAIHSDSEKSGQFLVTEGFFTCSWRFLISNKLEHLGFKLKKIIGI